MDPQPVDGLSASRLCAQAESLMRVRRDAEAIPILQQAIATDPQRTRPHCLMALAFMHLGEHARALKAAEAAVGLGPAEEWPHRLRSIILGKLGRWKAALEAASVAVRLAPEFPAALHAVASAELGCRRLREARETAERLRQLAPESALSHEILGRIALRRSRWREAEEHFRKAVAIEPGTWQYMANLGLALQGQGKKKEAIERFHDAARLDPSAEMPRKTLFRAVARYGSVSFLGIWLTLRALVMVLDQAPQDRTAAVAFVAICLVVLTAGGLWVWRRRHAELHPTVVAFYTDEARRQRRRFIRELPAAIGLISGTLVTLVWSLTWLQQGSENIGLRTWWGVLVYLLVALPTVAVYAVWGWRRWRSRRGL